ncbi:Protein of unknown function [Gryllus bimaculatus]|nr:Protein of unknown function [Gryllus bimaculatus]
MLGAASCSASSGGLQWRSMGSLRFMARSTARDRMRGSTYPRISIQKKDGTTKEVVRHFAQLRPGRNPWWRGCLRMNVTHFYNMYIGIMHRRHQMYHKPTEEKCTNSA